MSLFEGPPKEKQGFTGPELREALDKISSEKINLKTFIYLLFFLLNNTAIINTRFINKKKKCA